MHPIASAEQIARTTGRRKGYRLDVTGPVQRA